MELLPDGGLVKNGYKINYQKKCIIFDAQYYFTTGLLSNFKTEELCQRKD